MRTDPALVEAIETCHDEWDPSRSPETGGFDALLERWPDDPVALTAVGDAYDECGRTDEAISHYRAAMPGLDGTALRRCVLRLGDALRRAGRVDESAEVLEAGLEEFPGSRSLRTFLALALHEQGRTQAALGLVLEVLVDPAPSPDLELFRPAVRARAERLMAQTASPERRLILRDEFSIRHVPSGYSGRTLVPMQHRRLLRWLPAVVAPVVVAGVVAVPLVAAATPPDLPAKSAQQVLQLVAKAKDVRGFSGVVEQRSDLGLPSIGSMGPGSGTDTASALDLLSGTHTARVEVAGTTKARVAVLDSSAERDVVRNGRSVWVWNSKTNSAAHLLASGTEHAHRSQSLPTPAEAAQELLAKVDGTTRVSVDTAQQIADRDAYTLVLTPRTSATTVGSVRIAVDARTGLPLDVQVLARGASSPAFETGFTSISYAVPAASRFEFTPPKDAKVTTRTVTPGDRPARRPAGTGVRPAVEGSGWASVVTLPAGAAPSDLASNPTARRLTTAVRGGRVLHTALVNVLLTDDGRVLAGAVPVSRLESAAR